MCLEIIIYEVFSLHFVVNVKCCQNPVTCRDYYLEEDLRIGNVNCNLFHLSQLTAV